MSWCTIKKLFTHSLTSVWLHPDQVQRWRYAVTRGNELSKCWDGQL